MILNRATAIRKGPGFVVTRVPGWRVGGHIPRLVPSVVPHEGVQRSVSFATLVRRAPETANQAVDGLGVLGIDAAPPPSFLDTVSSSAGNLLTAGAQLYAQRQQGQSATDAARQQATLARLQLQKADADRAAMIAATGRAPAGSSNVMTYGLIAGGVAVALGLFFMLKKR